MIYTLALGPFSTTLLLTNKTVFASCSQALGVGLYRNFNIVLVFDYWNRGW